MTAEQLWFMLFPIVITISMYTTLSGGLGGAAKLNASAGWTEEWTWGK